VIGTLWPEDFLVREVPTLALARATDSSSSGPCSRRGGPSITLLRCSCQSLCKADCAGLPVSAPGFLPRSPGWGPFVRGQECRTALAGDYYCYYLHCGMAELPFCCKAVHTKCLMSTKQIPVDVGAQLFPRHRLPCAARCSLDQGAFLQRNLTFPPVQKRLARDSDNPR
jgi:hypothetical protein